MFGVETIKCIYASCISLLSCNKDGIFFPSELDNVSIITLTGINRVFTRHSMQARIQAYALTHVRILVQKK